MLTCLDCIKLPHTCLAPYLEGVVSFSKCLLSFQKLPNIDVQVKSVMF